MKTRAWSALAAVLLLTACAHPITIVPDSSQIPSAAPSRVSKNAGYYIAKAQRELQVTTSAGGGDKVSYFPFRDLEHGLFRILSSVFDRVYTMPALDDRAFVAANGIAFAFEPKITTESSSSNVLIWPPTDFTVSLACKSYDATGGLVWEKTVVGRGKATAGELMKDFSLAANRAAADALKQLQDAIVEEPVFRR